MGRKPRIQSEIGYYHVIVRGNNKKHLFYEASDFDQYLSFVVEYLPKHSIKLLHYCLMTNHAHMLLHAEAHLDLSRFMHGVQRSYHHYFRKKYTWFGHLFQGRYRSLPVESESYLLECGRYIEKNPVRAKLVENAEDWSYSSHRAYVTDKKQEFLTPNVMYLALSDRNGERQEMYRSYVAQTRVYEEFVDKELVGSC